MTNLWIVILIPLTLVAAGCSSDAHNIPSPAPDCYYLNPDKDLQRTGRVAIVELENDSTYPEISVDVTRTLFKELQKKQVFGLTVIRQDSPNWRNLQLHDVEPAYDLEKLVSIRKTLGCDAILTGTVTQFKPYPHMSVGLRVKILDLTDGQLLWALEQVWDSSDRTTAQKIKGYFKDQRRSAQASLKEPLVSVSTIEFLKFVCSEVGATLRINDQ
jgi:hypothetical protein